MKKVLIIEDNNDNSRLLTIALTRAGYDVISAQSGEDGCLLVGTPGILFILLDINLPGMDGFNVMSRLRDRPGGHPPVIAITSHAMTGDRERILSAGFCGYFEKPFDPVTIVDGIHRVLGLKS